MKIKIRWTRLIGFLILLLLLGVVFILLKSYFVGVFLLVLIVTAILSSLVSYRVVRECSSDIVVPVSRITEGEEADIRIISHNTSRIGLLGCDIRVRIDNIFLGVMSQFDVSLPLKVGTSELILPVNVDDIGRYEISIEQMRVSDLFGLIFFLIGDKSTKSYNKADMLERENLDIAKVALTNQRINKSEVLIVLPKKIDNNNQDINDIVAGATEADESDRRGSDSSEISEIREYRDGDRIRDVHWKLSARTDDLMVKERTSLSGTEIVVLLELVSDVAESTKLLRYSRGLLCALLDTEPDIRLLCFDAGKLGFDEYKIDSETALEDAYTDIFMEALSERTATTGEDVSVYLKNTYPYLENIVTIHQVGGLEHGQNL